MFEKMKSLFAKESPQMGGVEYIIAGLGNPGPKYELTRHNAGFLALDRLARELGARVDRLQFKSLCGQATIAGHRVLLMKPQSYMNRSGESVRDALQYYKLPPDRLLVIADDISMPLGKLRIRRKGTDGGHNGLKNIIYLTGADGFPRIKIGIGGKPHPDYDLADWVTSRFSDRELETLTEALERVPDAVQLMLAGNIDQAMGKYNG